jgi:NADPH:quinone reductase-like Zn-dependent oxidoreductase
MKAIQITQFGINGLAIGEVEKPQPTDNQVLVRVKAASLNYLDLLVVKGLFNNQLPLPHIPVTDVAGVIEQVGKNVQHLLVGDTVVPTFIRPWLKGNATFAEMDYAQRPSLGPPGYLAEYIVLDQTHVVKSTTSLSFEELATLPIAGLTAWNALKYCQLLPGQSVLLYGSGGVSTFAALFAKAQGLRVFVAGTKDHTLLQMKSLGVTEVFNVVNQPNWKQALIEATGGKGVDGVFDSVGGENLNHSLDLVKFRGKIVCVGLLQGFTANINLGSLLWKQASIVGMEVGNAEDLAAMLQALEFNNIRPVIGYTFTFAKAQAAFERLDQGGHFGKIVITLP